MDCGAEFLRSIKKKTGLFIKKRNLEIHEVVLNLPSKKYCPLKCKKKLLSAVLESTRLFLSAVPESTRHYLNAVQESARLFLSAVQESFCLTDGKKP